MTANLKIILPVVGSVLLVGALVTAFWMIGSASGERDRFSSLEIAPAEADVYFAINTDPTSPQWLAVNDSLDDIGAKDPIREAIDEALAEVNLDWEEDIVGIAGDEAYFSVPDVSKVSDGGGWVAGFRLRDEGGARDVFEKLRALAEEEDGEEFLEEEYEGVTIFYTEPTDVDGSGFFDDGGTSAEDDLFFDCLFSDDAESRAECAPLLECPWYTDDTADDTDYEDADGNFVPDACETGPFFEGDGFFGGFEDDGGDFGDSFDVSTGGAVAIFDNVLVIAAVPDDVKSVVDVVQGRVPSAETNERLQEFRAAQEDDFLMWGYVDMSPVWDMLEEGGFATGFGSEGGFGEEPFFPEEDPEVDAPQPDDFIIRSFDSEISFDEYGLIVRETITVDFGDTEKHGIYRDIPDHLPYDEESEELIFTFPYEVLQDGEPAEWEELYTGDGTRYKIGHPDVTISGQHVYEIEYSVGGGVRPVADGTYEVYWPVTGMWNVPIESVTARLTPPEGGEVLDADCSLSGEAGPGGFGCGVEFGPGTAVINGDLQAQNGINLVATVSGDLPFVEPFLVPVEFGSGFGDGDGVLDDELEFDPFAGVYPGQAVEQLRGMIDRMGFSVSSFDDGFSLDFTVLQAPDYEAAYEWEPSGAFDPHFANSVPEDTMFFLAMNTFYQQGYTQFREQLEGLSEEQREGYETLIEMIEDEIGINIETDLLALLTGETAIAGNLSGFDAETPDVEVVGLADIEDDAAMTETLQKLGAYLEEQGLIEADESGEVNLWKPFGAAESDAIGWSVEDGVAAIGYPWQLAGEREEPSDSLADTQDWQRTLALLPDDGVFVGYLSIARILEEVRSVPDAEASFEESTDGELTLNDLEPIRALGYSATIRENGFGYHLVLFMEDR
ncbi:MAG TPA: DUF3352 domain-containing protein [Dehalococcoidia bacterium]|nr:DUF3352 domain-containing protein [Dehalococcoidia bacterium]